MEKSKLMSQLEKMAELMKSANPNQRAFHQFQLESAKDVKVEDMKDVLTSAQIAKVKAVGIKMKECYRNALLVAIALDCEYVEGQLLCCGIGIEHAFNKINGHYFDVTKELALSESPANNEYISIGEYGNKEAEKVAIETKFYGGVFNYLYAKNSRN